MEVADHQPAKNQNEDTDAYCMRAMDEMRSQFGMPENGSGAIDLSIEASGAPACVSMGVYALKPA